MTQKALADVLGEQYKVYFVNDQQQQVKVLSMDEVFKYGKIRSQMWHIQLNPFKYE